VKFFALESGFVGEPTCATCRAVDTSVDVHVEVLDDDLR
jgi:hypothetical protein